jgi:type I restriction enzyme M protein
MPNSTPDKSLESWIWDAACSIRGARDAPKYKEFILPLIFTKRLCDVFDDEINRIAQEVGSRAKAFKLVKRDKNLVRFYLPLEPKNPAEAVWSIIRTLSNKIGEQLTTHLRAIADSNPLLKGIIDRVDFNTTTHGVRDLDDDRLSNLIEAISAKRLGLADVEPDIIGRSYEYLIRKFAEGSGQSAGEFYTPAEVGLIIARIMDAEPGMDIYDPCCGSAGLLIKCELVVQQKLRARTALSARNKSKEADKPVRAPKLKLYGQEYIATTWAMANMNMIIHDMEGRIELGDTFKNPKFRKANRLQTFDRVVANPMWNQDWWKEADYDADETREVFGLLWPRLRSGTRDCPRLSSRAYRSGFVDIVSSTATHLFIQKSAGSLQSGEELVLLWLRNSAIVCKDLDRSRGSLRERPMSRLRLHVSPARRNKSSKRFTLRQVFLSINGEVECKRK